MKKITVSIPKKILFVGLDNAGKTSIVQSLMGIKNLPLFSKMNPTQNAKQVQIKVSDSEFNIWDLGGQALFREEYLRDFDKFIFGTSKLIFVFDIQDTERYELAFQYFEKIIDLTEEKVKGNDFEVSIFFHKFDPDLKRSNMPDAIINGLKDKVKAKLDGKNLFYQIFLTTIYAIFEKVVID